MQTRFLLFAVLALLAGAALTPSRSLGHAFLDHAEPRVGSALHTPPDAVRLTFTEPVEADFSHVEVVDAQGVRVDSAPPEHPKAAVLRVPLPRLPPGEYTVHWAVTSVDTHQTEGRFDVTVAQP